MGRVRFLVTFLVLLASILPVRHARSAAALERGAAIIDPGALRELDRGRFGLGRVMLPARSADTPLTNSELLALPSMMPVRKALDAEFDRYIARQKANLPNETIGVGTAFDFQLFDRALLVSPDTRFVLAGIVNRMDRAYVHEADCGEIRLIYRLTRTDVPETTGEGAISPRLPMTLNVVLKARGTSAIDGSGKVLACAEIARRWLAAGEWSLTGAALAERLTAKDGPLELIGPDDITHIETNLQIAHAPKSAVRDFRTDYLLKVFDYDAPSKTFIEAPMENQIDRERILGDAKLGREFKAWLLEPSHFAELDRGTILVPDQFLATAAIAPTPAGFSASDLQPAFGLVQGDDAPVEPLFKNADVVAALKKAAETRHRAAKRSLGRGLRAKAQRHHLRRLPSDPRHRRLSFPRRRLDGGEAQQFNGGAGVAAFLRRPDPPPRHPHRTARRQAPGLLARLLQPAATARQCGTRRHRIRRRLGRLLLCPARQCCR